MSVDTCAHFTSDTHLLAKIPVTDWVGDGDPLMGVIHRSHLNAVLEAERVEIATVSGDAAGHPGVVSSWLGTHPAAADWLWSKAPVTPWPLGDGPTWSRGHRIYQAPSPSSGCWDHGLICKHGAHLPQGTTVSKGSVASAVASAIGVVSRVDDGHIPVLPSGIGGLPSEDSLMYFEYESGVLRAPGARGLFSASMVMNASNAERPPGGTNYIQHTIDSALAATMGIESKIALASCFASKAADFAKAAAIFSNKMLEIIGVPVNKQRLASIASGTTTPRPSKP